VVRANFSRKSGKMGHPEPSSRDSCSYRLPSFRAGVAQPLPETVTNSIEIMSTQVLSKKERWGFDEMPSFYHLSSLCAPKSTNKNCS
jgi:hypothetical protein